MKNLLIVDDEPILLENMRFLLGPMTAKIFTAANGKEGLEALSKEIIHCVICDITMPVMSGVEFIREARRRGITVPFIFYSAYGNHEMMLEVSRYGAFDFLKKPDFDDLETVVRRGLEEGFHRRDPSHRGNECLSEYLQLLEQIKNTSTPPETE